MKEKVSFPLDKHGWSPSVLIGQVVLVTTLNVDGQSNIAPKSWVSMMAFQPPMLAIGCNLEHLTAQNILREREFVVNIPGKDLAETIWRISALPHPRPVELTGLRAVPASKVKPPLVEECKAHLECVLAHTVTFGSEIVLFGEIVAISLDKSVLDDADPYAALQMIVFLENKQYGVIERAYRIDDP